METGKARSAFGALLVVGLATTGFLQMRRVRGLNSRPSAAPRLMPKVTRTQAIGDGRNSLGPANTPVALVEFADYECPACKPAHDKLKLWTREHPGVRFVFRHFPLTSIHPYALVAAVAAEAAGEQGKFWQMHDALYAHQGKLTRPELEGYASELGLDAGAFKRAFSRRSAAVARIDADAKAASNLKLDGTPTLLWCDASGAVKSVQVDDLDNLEF